MFAVAAAGPVIGYTVSRYILAIYVDADRIDPEEYVYIFLNINS